MLSRACLVLILAFLVAILESCSLEDKAPRNIRAHVEIKDGIPHARGLGHAERYCQVCHGVNLRGGDGPQPSCYTCHGSKWLASDPSFRFAPADHTAIKGERFYHQPELTEVKQVCTQCHGQDLLGDRTLGTPSCFLCHESYW